MREYIGLKKQDIDIPKVMLGSKDEHYWEVSSFLMKMTNEVYTPEELEKFDGVYSWTVLDALKFEFETIDEHELISTPTYYENLLLRRLGLYEKYKERYKESGTRNRYQTLVEHIGQPIRHEKYYKEQMEKYQIDASIFTLTALDLLGYNLEDHLVECETKKGDSISMTNNRVLDYLIGGNELRLKQGVIELIKLRREGDINDYVSLVEAEYGEYGRVNIMSDMRYSFKTRRDILETYMETGIDPRLINIPKEEWTSENMKEFRRISNEWRKEKQRDLELY